jgi:hypothetical protein
LSYLPRLHRRRIWRQSDPEELALKDSFAASAVSRRVNRPLALGLLVALAASSAARADLATPEQKRACTPDVYRLCAGEIPNVRAITACLRRQKANLSEACRAVFEQ